MAPDNYRVLGPGSVKLMQKDKNRLPTRLRVLRCETCTGVFTKKEGQRAPERRRGTDYRGNDVAIAKER